VCPQGTDTSSISDKATASIALLEDYSLFHSIIQNHPGVVGDYKTWTVVEQMKWTLVFLAQHTVDETNSNSRSSCTTHTWRTGEVTSDAAFRGTYSKVFCCAALVLRFMGSVIDMPARVLTISQST
jgi:hypothetical protein